MKLFLFGWATYSVVWFLCFAVFAIVIGAPLLGAGILAIIAGLATVWQQW